MRFLAALLVLVFLLPATLSGQSGSVSLPIGSEGPSAQLQDLDGNTVELNNYTSGKPALIEFWASWCEQCEALQPQLDEIQSSYGDRMNIIAVAVGVSQSVRRVKRHLEEHDPGYPFLWDARGILPDVLVDEVNLDVVDRLGLAVHLGLPADGIDVVVEVNECLVSPADVGGRNSGPLGDFAAGRLDVDVELPERLDLEGVVGDQLHAGYLHFGENVRDTVVRALVIVKTKMAIGVHRVKTTILQFVGGDFVRKPDPTPLLRHVNDGPAVCHDVGERHVKLLLAVAALGSHHFGREALVVHSHDDTAFAAQVAAVHHNRLHLDPLEDALAVPPHIFRSLVAVRSQAVHAAIGGHAALGNKIGGALVVASLTSLVIVDAGAPQVVACRVCLHPHPQPLAPDTIKQPA